MAYNTILTMYQSPNDNETYDNMTVYNSYYSYDPVDIIKPEPQSNTQNYSYDSVDIIKLEPQLNTQNIIDIASTFFIIAFVCLVISFLYLYLT
jgi:hypothetical protein